MLAVKANPPKFVFSNVCQAASFEDFARGLIKFFYFKLTIKRVHTHWFSKDANDTIKTATSGIPSLCTW